jgi:hypothetical protein
LSGVKVFSASVRLARKNTKNLISRTHIKAS